ncbi:phosphatase PAP2 family protein [Acinetobacter venetianus]|uniref:phosphatase PAP2 family protein n=1 Tax=Acinetobacter venetianus TaxID=52133 RepID=UPI0010A639ED|nr:phosphatase PAP2 family protein [Acinetobacter venetianus]MCR4531491.1 phosphatase PAP2 family protein [Acinetobacter venetianus]MDA0697422.1 phosphatase PAP2 family protein [Pseudomonadota bacterium]MDA1254299.1 phosphatase PAP2 family protein [Pseudomonadota bacterium]
MSFEDLNIYLFHSVNSFATHSLAFDRVMIFLANDLNTVFISFLVFLLVIQWKTYRLLFAKTLFIVLLSIAFSDLIEMFYHHPRPFQLDLGHKLIGHGSSSSFPSQHTLTIAVIAFTYLIAGYRAIGIMGLFVGVIVGLARVYVGVHFPFDVIGSFVIGFLLVVSTNYVIKGLLLRRRRINLAVE